MLRQSSEYDEATLVAQIEQWLRRGRTVYWVGELPAAYDTLPVSNEFTHVIDSQSLARSYEAKPDQLTEHRWVFDIKRFGEE